MNERIKLLAEQAGYLPDMFGIGHWDMPECKKFAELIVQDCVGVVNVWSDEQPCSEGYDILTVSKIKQHFGVD
jgi:hypothetical protein